MSHILLLGSFGLSESYLKTYLAEVEGDFHLYGYASPIASVGSRAVEALTLEQLSASSIDVVMHLDVTLNDRECAVLLGLVQQGVKIRLSPRQIIRDGMSDIARYGENVTCRLNSWYSPYFQYVLKQFPFDKHQPLSVSCCVNVVSDKLLLDDVIENIFVSLLLLQTQAMAFEISCLSNCLVIIGQSKSQSFLGQWTFGSASEFNKTTIQYEHHLAEISIPSCDTIDRPGFVEIHENNKIKEHLAPYDFGFKFNEFEKLDGSQELSNRLLFMGKILILPFELVESVRKLLNRFPDEILKKMI